MRGPATRSSCSIDEVRPGGWGVTFGDGTPYGWTIRDGQATDERGATVALAPFLGVIGMPPPEPGVHSTAPPRRWGGNIDCKLLVAGTTLYLPIPLDGALLSAGDGHGAQGDGEVSGTAIECPLERAQLTLELRDGPELRMPVARIADAWVAFGFDEDLDVAAELATETMLDLMEREHGLDRCVRARARERRGRPPCHAARQRRQGRARRAPRRRPAALGSCQVTMGYEFKLPDLGEGLSEGEIARWLVQEGQEIAEDDPLVEIATDKTTVEIPSPAAGVVAKILVAAGEVVPVGTVLVVIGGDAAEPRPASDNLLQAEKAAAGAAGRAAGGTETGK